METIINHTTPTNKQTNTDGTTEALGYVNPCCRPYYGPPPGITDYAPALIEEMMVQPPPPHAGELVPVTVEWRDERGWTNQESPYSDLMRRSWELTERATYYRIQTVGSQTMVLAPFSQQDTQLQQSVVAKSPVYGFAGVFYYKISPLPASPE